MPGRPYTIVQVSDHSPLGDFVYRVHEPAAALGELGTCNVYDVHYFSRFRDEAAIAADIAIIYLLLDIEIFRVIDQRRKLGKPTFVEINDFFFDVHPWNRAYKSWSNVHNQKIFTSLMSRADAVQVSSDELARRFSKYNKEVGVFPNHIAQLPPPRAKRNGTKMVVGWGGSAGHLRDIQAAAPVLCRWLAAHPEAHLKIMGPPAFETLFKAAPRDRFTFEIAGPLDHYCRFLRTLDVGLGPLLATDYNRCRSDVKFIEYCAHGVVGVMQRLEPYDRTVRQGDNGFSYSTDAELLTILDRLAAAPALRERVAQSAYAYVRKERLLSQHIKHRLNFYQAHERRVKAAAQAEASADLIRRASLDVRLLPGLIPAGTNYWRLKAGTPAELKYLEGSDLLVKDEIADATAAFQEAVQLAPDYYQAHYFLGRCLWRQGKLQEAEREYLKAAKINTDYSRAWMSLSELYNHLSKAYAKKTAELNPPLY